VATAQLNVDVVPLADVDGALVSAWRDLAERAAEPNPFHEPEVVLAARHLGARRVSLVLVADGSRLHGCLPVRPVGRGPGVRLPALTAWRHIHCYLGTPLVDRDRTEEVLELLFASRRRSLLPLQVIERFGSCGPVFRALRAACARRGVPVEVIWTTSRAVNHKHDPARPSKDRARRLARARRRLEQRIGAPARVVDRAGDPAAVETFLELELSGWKGRHGTALACDRGESQFFRDMCSGLAARGKLQLRSLELGDRVVAMKCNLVAGRAVFCFKSAFDEGVAAMSPGVQLEVSDLAAFEAGDAEWMDSCAAVDNEMINQLYPSRRTLFDVAVPVGDLGATLLRGISRADRARSRDRSRVGA
jgi:CelD/BcsL family acetyltransferase involved in cellulose biosynthesis